MADEGYRNFAFFARDRIFRRRTVRRHLSLERSDALTTLSNEFNRIGVNYNQVVRKVNAILNARSRDSRAALRVVELGGRLDRLYALTLEMNERMAEVLSSKEDQTCSR